MAKSTKKTEPAATDTAAPKPAAKKSAPKKPLATKKPPATIGAPLIDTSLAAATAARMVSAKAGSQASSSDAAKKPETSSFKQLKESLAKPHVGGMNNLLNDTASPAAKRGTGGMPFGGSFNKQVGHNQTFGGNRTGVPRRNPG